jgi:poly(3-hydroxybutyrate) depolymerase
MKRTTRRALTSVAAVAMFGALAPMASSTVEPSSTSADEATLASLPQVTTGARPGAPVLYEPAPVAPQLENRHPAFVAPFDRVSGTDRYVDGEYLYTDHIWDDSGDGLSYPTDRGRFAGNAADLVEFRISAREEGVTLYRFTLNSLLAPDTTRVAVAFDTDQDPATGSAELPDEPGAPFPGTDAVLSAWGTGATWSSWDGSAWSAEPLPVDVDVDANQITVAVPDAVAEPTGTWRTTLAVGLHDAETGGFLAPQGSATATRPGGGDGKAAIFNLGFRFDEAILSRSAPPDSDQSAALAAREPTRFAHDIDFDAIAARASATTVPEHGTMVRFFPSRLSLGEGRGPGFPALLGQLQAYSVYVPTSDAPDVRSPLTLNLHSLGERHWQYNGSTGVQQLGEERGSLVATADARGTDGWYQNEAEYDVFEMWNDIARHHTLDPDATAITGYSMGGYATYRLGTLYPDLFGAAVTVVGPPGDGIWMGAGAPTGGAETLSNLWLENARNVPYMNIVAAADELVPISGTTQQSIGPAGGGRTSFDALGYRYAFDVYPAAEHLTLAILGYDLPQAAAFLGDAAVDRDPFHVTFAYTPAADDPELGLVHDHAYWVSDIALADPTVGVAVSSLSAPIGKGVVDVESLAFGIDDPTPTRGNGAGTVPLPYVETNQTWGEHPEREAVNGFELTLTNVGAVTLDLTRARVTSEEPIELRHDGDSDAVVTLVDEAGTRVDVPVPAGAGVIVVDPAAFGHGDGDGGGDGGQADERRCVPARDARPRGCPPEGRGPAGGT